MIVNVLCAVLCFLWCQALLSHGGQMQAARVVIRRPRTIIRYCTVQSAAGSYRRLEMVSV